MRLFWAPSVTNIEIPVMFHRLKNSKAVFDSCPLFWCEGPDGFNANFGRATNVVTIEEIDLADTPLPESDLVTIELFSFLNGH